jgi:hypothetical protein
MPGVASPKAVLLALTVAAAATGQARAGALTAAQFQPAGCKESFADVPASNDYCPWIEQLFADGVASTCAQGKYCPDAPVTRQQVALLLERAMRGTASWQVDAATLDGLDSSAFVTASSLQWKSLRRRYYLDYPNYTGDHALEACQAPGYHVASLWEIHDLGSLIYAHPPGVGAPDGSEGPPTGQIGWVMTGGYPSNLNCQNWTSATGTGALAYLPELGLGWFVNDNGTSENVDYNTVPWKTVLFSCGEPTGVWCVED